MKKLLFLLPLLLLLACTDENVVYKEMEDVGSESVSMDNIGQSRTWDAATDVKTFEVPITEAQAGQAYDVAVELRHTHTLPLENAPLKVTAMGPDGSVIKEESTIFGIRDKDTREPLGHHAGDIVDTRHVVFPEMKFPSAGTYTFKITHELQGGEMPMMMQVGLMVKKAGTEVPQ